MGKGRPKKWTVDFFSHYCKQGKIIDILESQFGNDGYAFWFKLLELLGSHEHHFISYKKGVNKNYLLAKTLVDEETAEKILDLLAELEAIDSELWKNEKIIWSEKFIKKVEIVYNKRDGTPQKPISNTENTNEQVFRGENSSKNDFPERKIEGEAFYGEKNPQTKEKKTKEEKSKEMESLVTKAYKNYFNQTNQNNINILQSYLNNGMKEKLIIRAMKITNKKNKSFNYCRGILKNWSDDGINEIKDLNKMHEDPLKATISDEEIRELVDGG